MTNLTIRWKRIGNHTLPVPTRAHAGDAGLDLSVVVDGEAFTGHLPSKCTVSVTPDRLVTFRTGWAVEIPTGWFGLIVVRSSIGKAGWDIESSGVIDAAYRGEIFIPMVYRGDPFGRAGIVEHGQRMAQMLILPVPSVECVEVDDLSATERGAGGFGSSGK